MRSLLKIRDKTEVTNGSHHEKSGSCLIHCDYDKAGLLEVTSVLVVVGEEVRKMNIIRINGKT